MELRTVNIFLLIFTFILFCTFIVSCTEFSVGVSPSVVEVGEMEKGTSKIVKFRLVTVSPDPLLVYMKPETGRIDFFIKDPYESLIYNFSEENTLGWIEVFNNPSELIPSGNVAGTSIKAWKEITVLISVPENAEPGYHIVSVKPEPYVPETTGGPVGALIVAVTSVNFIFNVKGDAKREGIILDVIEASYTPKSLKLNTYFKNTGTTTISARAHHKIYSKDRNFIAEGYSPEEYVKPQQLVVFEAPVDAVIMPGEYDVSTSVYYTTGTSQRNTTITLERPIAPAVIAPPPLAIPPWLLIFIVLILFVSFVIYRRK